MTFNHISAGLRKYVTQSKPSNFYENVSKLIFLFPVHPSEN